MIISLLTIVPVLSCSGPYKHLERTEQNSSALQFKPRFNKALYRCVVDGRIVFKKFHLSGLLFFKTMDDGTTRVIFQNEMGLTFFDFEWDRSDSFKVNQIIPQLDRAALVKVLEKDMNLLLMKGLDNMSESLFRKGDELYYRFALEKGVVYYITRDNALERIENAGKRKVTTISLAGKKEDAAMPDTVLFNHHKANFTIRLTKIESDAAE